jgi:hypothetical protein
MSLSKILNSEAVLAAIEEFEKLGRFEFLRKYGFKKAREYYLVYNGQYYDSKAITGVAHGYDNPQLGPLNSSEFSGGENTVKRKLETLGFEVLRIPVKPLWAIYVEKDAYNNFVIGRQLGVWGAKTEGKFAGINEGDLVFFIHLITAKPNSKRGFPRLNLGDFWEAADKAQLIVHAEVTSVVYEDNSIVWDDDVYPHRFNFREIVTTRNIDLQNKFSRPQFDSIRRSFLSGGKAIEITDMPIKFYAEHSSGKLVDSDIQPIDMETYYEKQEIQEREFKKKTGKELLESLKGKITPKQRSVKSNRYDRDARVSVLAKRRGAGFCQLCEEAAPFIKSDGEPYLEAHHIYWLSLGGSDTLDNAVALCPNCHRKMHALNRHEDVKSLKIKANIMHW